MRHLLVSLLMFLTSISEASCLKEDVVNNVRPNASYIWSGDTYDGLNWKDSVQTKPTVAELQNGLAECLNHDSTLRKQMQNDIFNLNLSTNTAQRKLQALTDLLQARGLLQ